MKNRCDQNIVEYDYDKESEVLCIRGGGGKSIDSDIQRNVVIDYDKNWDVMAINVYNFSFEMFKKVRSGLQTLAKKGVAVK